MPNFNNEANSKPEIVSDEEARGLNVPPGTTKKEAEAMLDPITDEEAERRKNWAANVDRTEKLLAQGTIKLPEDPVKEEQLVRKLAEYRKRMDPAKSSLSPEDPRDAKYKATILSILLEGGSANEDSIRNGLLIMSQDKGQPEFDEKIFSNAFKVIKSYAETGGKDVKRGTGLK